MPGTDQQQLATTLVIRKLPEEAAKALERFKSHHYNPNVNTTAAICMMEQYWRLKDTIKEQEDKVAALERKLSGLCRAIEQQKYSQGMINNYLEEWQLSQ